MSDLHFWLFKGSSPSGNSNLPYSSFETKDAGYSLNVIAAPKGIGVQSRYPANMMLAVGLEPTPLALRKGRPTRSARLAQCDVSKTTEK